MVRFRCMKFLRTFGTKKVVAANSFKRLHTYTCHVIDVNVLFVLTGGPDYELISLAIFSIIFAGTTNTYATSAWCLAFVASDANLVR